MDRLNHDLNIKQEEEGDVIVKQVQPCTKVKKEEEGDGECKLEWDGDECDCLECRVDRTIKVEINQNNATNNQQKDCPGISDAKKGVVEQSSVCKRVKKEENEIDDEQWNEDCDCDDCRRMRLKVIRLKQSNLAQNEAGCDDDDGNGNEDVLVDKDANMTVDHQIGDEMDQKGEQSGDGLESSEDQTSDVDDEEYEMEVDGEVSSDDEKTEVDEQLDKEPDDQLHQNAQSEGEFKMLCSLANDTRNIQNDEENDNNEKCVSERNMEQSTPSTSGVRSSTRKRIQTKVFGDLVQSNGNPRYSAKRKSDQANESVKKLKPKYVLLDDEATDSDDNGDHATNAIGEEIATECTTNPTQANLAQSNRHLQCPHCHKSFDRPSTLQRHLRVHSGERPFRCDHCDKRFNDRSNLAAHQLIHQNMKFFQCDQCDKQFNHKATLNTHLLVHSGVRPHQCRFCDKSFTGLCNRNSHEQAIHLHVKPYRCKQCSQTATERSRIIKHIRVVHFGLPPTFKEQRELNIIDDRDPKELVEKV